MWTQWTREESLREEVREPFGRPNPYRQYDDIEVNPRSVAVLFDVPIRGALDVDARRVSDGQRGKAMRCCTRCAYFLVASPSGSRFDVSILQEIDKVVDEKTLFSLLMPWELGRCSFAAGQRHVNARSVIWIATANTGHQLVFDHQSQRADPDSAMDRKEYMELINLFRPDVTECLGVSELLCLSSLGLLTSRTNIGFVGFSRNDRPPFRSLHSRREARDGFPSPFPPRRRARSINVLRGHRQARLRRRGCIYPL